MDRRRPKRHSSLPSVLLALCLVAIGAGAFLFLRSYLKSPAPPMPHIIDEVHLIRPPPPPPVTPPPPPPPEEKAEVHEPQQPDQKPSNEPPPSQQLGLDTQGGAGSDAFGLVGNQGGATCSPLAGACSPGARES